MASRSAREVAYETIRSRIITMDLKPGDELNDRELAQELGISRTPMREALILLNNAHMVAIKPQSGTHVAPIDLHLMELEQFSRYTLEKEILTRMCGRLTPEQEAGYRQLNVEVYGGAILNTWLDRPLGIAGRVAVRTQDAFAPKIVEFVSEKNLLTIPNLAIHMNREVNKGVELNRQTDMLPVFALLPEEEKKADYFLTFLADELSVEKTDILDFELTVYCKENPEFIGLNDDFISSPRLDNLTSCAALISGLMDARRMEGINLIALFDHEEIGSHTKQGAGSILLHDMLRRILKELGREQTAEQDLYRSMLLSVDVAHGIHPNQAGKMDLTNKPVLGRGFCIKEASSQSYATDCEAIAIIQQICEKEKIAYQKFVNRSDMPGGSTLGSIASALLPVKTVDIGIPLLAMHSARELMGSADQQALKDLVTAYFTLAS